jgi:pimeloyl-ACP methyl ester carboxylesterase
VQPRIHGGNVRGVVAQKGLPPLTGRSNVLEWGKADAPPILFIQGWSQNDLCWRKQYERQLADAFHLVALDLRGHGIKLLKHDPSVGIRRAKSKEIRAWTDAEMKAFEKRWPIGTKPRTAYELMRNVGTARVDLHQMTWSQVHYPPQDRCDGRSGHQR